MPGAEPLHGFDDDAMTRELLRSPPSQAALSWATECVGAEVAGWEVLRGGTSSAMYLLRFAGGGHPELVLRCYVRAELNLEEPDLAAREAAALRVVGGADVPAPWLAAVDVTGDRAGVPAVLMTRLRGRVVWDPKGVTQWLRGLANALPAVHAVDVGDEPIGRYFNYRQQSYAPPRWATNPAMWEKAVELFHGPTLEHSQRFIHRDYHPGNVLWERGRVSGLVDWQAACIGPPSVDIGHCRANFLRYAPELADVFTRHAERALGTQFHPWADVAALIGMLDGLRRTPPRPLGRGAIDSAIEHAVVALSP
jgi:aminoglycoside phosphotransferase (APT) family kinase protein